MKARVKTEKEMRELYGENWIQKAEKTETGWVPIMGSFLGETIEVEDADENGEYYGIWYWRKEWLVFDEESGENE